jgi:uncharacterized protein YkwD
MKHKKKQRPTIRKSRDRKTGILHHARFLPAILILTFSIALHTQPASGVIKKSDVLSYSTSMSGSELLANSNTQREANGAADLALNNQLTSAAQTKANDMVARDYWSHTTPDGRQPWAFMTDTGYQYTTAGENLAYGFANSADTITGWMNSPPHRQNLLSTAFKDVGFGFANSANFVNNGQQTVVVAMYGAQTNSKPAAAPAPTTQAVTTPPPAQANSSNPAATAQPTSSPTPTQTPPATQPIQTTIPVAPPITVQETKAVQSTPPQTPKTFVETTAAVVAKPSKVSRIQVLTGGKAAWSNSILLVTLAGFGIVWVITRGIQISRIIRSGESFIRHHIHLDFTVLSLFVLGWTFLQASGTIR